MFLAVVMIAAGSALTVVGVRMATERKRPASLAGALLGAAGLLGALLGAASLAVPRFWSR